MKRVRRREKKGEETMKKRRKENKSDQKQKKRKAKGECVREKERNQL